MVYFQTVHRLVHVTVVFLEKKQGDVEQILLRNFLIKSSKNNDSHAVKYQGVNRFLKELSILAE